MATCQNQACTNTATKRIHLVEPARRLPPGRPVGPGEAMVLVPVDLCDTCTEAATTTAAVPGP